MRPEKIVEMQRYGRKLDARSFAENLPDDPNVLVDMTVGNGGGLAIWCDLFPDARVLGLDIDLDGYDYLKLKNAGAFQRSNPEVYLFDKRYDNISSILDGDKIDVLIETGGKGSDRFMKHVRKFLADDFDIFCEDWGQYDGYYVVSNCGVTVLK